MVSKFFKEEFLLLFVFHFQNLSPCWPTDQCLTDWKTLRWSEVTKLVMTAGAFPRGHLLLGETVASCCPRCARDNGVWSGHSKTRDTEQCLAKVSELQNHKGPMLVLTLRGWIWDDALISAFFIRTSTTHTLYTDAGSLLPSALQEPRNRDKAFICRESRTYCHCSRHAVHIHPWTVTPEQYRAEDWGNVSPSDHTWALFLTATLCFLLRVHTSSTLLHTK